MPADSGAAEQITFDGGYAAQQSDDGVSVFFAKLDAPGILPPHAGGIDVDSTGEWLYFAR
ncbi:MAG: hypothetical protein OEO23_08990 [Gemmatimonadota bacterium]|nr:hypothetical protein [Gemmatimonadota bacterium]